MGKIKMFRASNLEGVRETPMLLLLLFIFRDHF